MPVKKPHPVLLSLLSGLLLCASWYRPFTPLIFIAWIPLLMLDEQFSAIPDLRRRKLKLTLLSVLAFFTWNIGATWWVAYASFGGACFAFVGNTLLMSAVFMIFHNIKRRIQKPWAVWLLVPVWLAWEFGHTLWSITWPWLTLGNVFAFRHNWVQWYEYTGTSGGSLWALAVNILLFGAMKQAPLDFKKYLPAVSVIIIPIILSYTILFSQPTAQAPGLTSQVSNLKSQISPLPSHILIVQPNIDPYSEKFYVKPEVQLKNMLKQIEGKLDSTIDYLVLPETFLTEDISENTLDDSYSVNFLKDRIIRRFPKLKIVTGAATYRFYNPGDEVSATARKADDGRYYDYYNTALQIDSTPHVQVYHKSRLVPGAEQMPFPWLLKPLEKFALDLGGTTGSLGIQKERSAFFNPDNSLGIAPVICYESIYSDYTTDYIRHGANLIFIITNDGWWDDTPGYIQHLNYARLRAIETRCPIARSANTGISCFIDQNGEISQPTKWWEAAVIKGELEPNYRETFYVRFGDLLSRCAVVITLLSIAFAQFLRFKKS